MFNIYRSNLKSRQITGLMTSCADLWYLTCVHTVRFKQAQRMEELLPWPGCSPGVFSAGCCCCPLGMFKTLLEGSRYAPMDHGPPFQPSDRENFLPASCPTCFPHCAHPKNNWGSSGTEPAAKEALCAKAKPPAWHWFPGFYLSGKEHIRLFSRSLQ